MSDDKHGMWVIAELFGHRKLGGYITEHEIAGVGFIRLDVFPGDAVTPIASQFYNPKAFYGITPVTEAVARAFAAGHQPAPVTRWELPQLGARDALDNDRDNERDVADLLDGGFLEDNG